MINEFKTYLVNIKGYAVNTAVSYEKDLRTFVQFIKAQSAAATWSSITQSDVDKYVIYLSQTHHKPATICRHISSISALYRYMKRQGLEVVNPAQYESRPKIAKTIPNTIPTEDIKSAIEHANGMMKCIIRLLLETGIRISELQSIKGEDINMKTGAIKIHGKGMKERYVYVNASTLNMLQLFMTTPSSTLFGMYEQRELRKEIYESLKGHTIAKQKSPHAIRHTYATEMARRGMTATTLQKSLGHEHLNTTQRYIDLGQVSNEIECRQLSLFN